MNKIVAFVTFVAVLGYATSAIADVVEPQEKELQQDAKNYFEIGDEEQENTARNVPLVLPKELGEGLPEIEAARRGSCSGCRSYCVRQKKNGWACYNGYCTCF